MVMCFCDIIIVDLNSMFFYVGVRQTTHHLHRWVQVHNCLVVGHVIINLVILHSLPGKTLSVVRIFLFIFFIDIIFFVLFCSRLRTGAIARDWPRAIVVAAVTILGSS
jgi:hypothetical protein